MSPPNNHNHHHRLPKRIILMRHGESMGNLDGSAYTTTPDNRIPLTDAGIAQARRAGKLLRETVSVGAGSSESWRVHFYVSPYERTRSTLREVGRSFSRRRVIGVREVCQIREQDFGNFQVEEEMKEVKETRLRFGRFFYRFPDGESAADVFDRVSSFLESLWRDIDLNRLHHEQDDLNFVIVSHGLTSRVFMMKWFKWTVEQFESLNNLGNCEFRVMELGPGGEYSLAFHHSDEELRDWGLSPEMIEDQKWRAGASRGDWNEKYLNTFFDSLPDSDQEQEHEEAANGDDNVKLGSFLPESGKFTLLGEERLGSLSGGLAGLDSGTALLGFAPVVKRGSSGEGDESLCALQRLVGHSFEKA